MHGRYPETTITIPPLCPTLVKNMMKTPSTFRSSWKTPPLCPAQPGHYAPPPPTLPTPYAGLGKRRRQWGGKYIKMPSYPRTLPSLPSLSVGPPNSLCVPRFPEQNFAPLLLVGAEAGLQAGVLLDQRHVLGKACHEKYAVNVREGPRGVHGVQYGTCLISTHVEVSFSPDVQRYFSDTSFRDWHFQPCFVLALTPPLHLPVSSVQGHLS